MESPSTSPPSPPVEERRVATLEALISLKHRAPDLAFRAVLVGGFAVMIAPMALPLVMGGLLAVVLSGPNGRIERALRARSTRAAGLAPALTTFAALVLVVAPFAWFSAKAFATLGAVAQSLSGDGLGDTRARLADVVANRLGFEHAAAHELVATGARRLATAAGQVLGLLARGLPDGITNFFLFLLALYFGLRDGARVVAWAARVSPVPAERTQELFAAVRRSVEGTLVGMVVVASLQGGLAFLALLACRVPHPVLWGFAATLASAIPILGTTPVTLGAALYLAVEDRPIAAVGMLVAAVLIGLSDNVVRPWVQSQHDDIHPLVALLSIFGGLAMFGPVGLLLGPVLASMSTWAIETYRDEPDRPSLGAPP